MLRLTRAFQAPITATTNWHWKSFARFVDKCFDVTKFNSVRSMHLGIMEDIVGIIDIPMNDELDLCERGKLLC